MALFLLDRSACAFPRALRRTRKSHPMHRLLAALLPSIQGGARLHHAALEALHRGDPREADRLLERAALAYRHELAIEPLARARVHQLIARVRAYPGGAEVGERTLEIERRLCGLDRIEALEPPFALVEARELLATWVTQGRTAANDRHDAAA